jgi:hypothetical protein
VLFVDGNFENPDPDHLTTLYTGDRFVLYRINSSQIADVRRTAKADVRKTPKTVK